MIYQSQDPYQKSMSSISFPNFDYLPQQLLYKIMQEYSATSYIRRVFVFNLLRQKIMEKLPPDKAKIIQKHIDYQTNAWRADEIIVLQENTKGILKKLFKPEIVYMVPKGKQKSFKKNESYFQYPFYENVNFFESLEEAKKYIQEKIIELKGGREMDMIVVLLKRQDKKEFKDYTFIRQFHLNKETQKDGVNDDSIVLSENQKELFGKLKKKQKYFANFINIFSMDGRSENFQSACNLRGLILPHSRVQAKEDFLKLADNGIFRDKQIKKFRKQYPLNKNKAEILGWYCSQTFFYKLLNKGLRILKKPTELAYLRLPFSDIFWTILDLYKEQADEQFRQKDEFVCYRGCLLTERQKNLYFSSDENIKKYFQMFGFLSTSFSKKVGLNYAFSKGNTLIQIRVQRKNLGGDFDYGFIDATSFSPWGESEILFNPSIFRLVSIEDVQEKYEYFSKSFQSRKVTVIKLEYYTHRHPEDVKSEPISNYFRKIPRLNKTITDQGSWLLKSKDYKNAQIWLNKALKQSKSEEQRQTIKFNLLVTYLIEIQNVSNAIDVQKTFREECLKLLEQINPPNKQQKQSLLWLMLLMLEFKMNKSLPTEHYKTSKAIEFLETEEIPPEKTITYFKQKKFKKFKSQKQIIERTKQMIGTINVDFINSYLLSESKKYVPNIGQLSQLRQSLIRQQKSNLISFENQQKLILLIQARHFLFDSNASQFENFYAAIKRYLNFQIKTQDYFFMNINFIKLFLKNKKYTDAYNQINNSILYFMGPQEFCSFLDLMKEINIIEGEYRKLQLNKMVQKMNYIMEECEYERLNVIFSIEVIRFYRNHHCGQGDRKNLKRNIKRVLKVLKVKYNHYERKHNQNTKYGALRLLNRQIDVAYQEIQKINLRIYLYHYQRELDVIVVWKKLEEIYNYLTKETLAKFCSKSYCRQIQKKIKLICPLI